MARFENVQGITKICFNQNIQCFCPLGNDWYTNHVYIEIIPNKVIPDYCEVDEFLRSLGGESLVIEDVIDKVFKYFKEEYKCSSVKVSSYVNDAKHLSVRVLKED